MFVFMSCFYKLGERRTNVKWSLHSFIFPKFIITWVVVWIHDSLISELNVYTYILYIYKYVYMCIYLYVYIYSIFSKILRFLRSIHTTFPNGFTSLHSHQPCIKIPFPPHLISRLFFGFWMIAILNEVSWDFIVVLVESPWWLAFPSIFHVSVALCVSYLKQLKENQEKIEGLSEWDGRMEG